MRKFLITNGEIINFDSNKHILDIEERLIYPYKKDNEGNILIAASDFYTIEEEINGGNPAYNSGAKNIKLTTVKELLRELEGLDDHLSVNIYDGEINNVRALLKANGENNFKELIFDHFSNINPEEVKSYGFNKVDKIIIEPYLKELKEELSKIEPERTLNLLANNITCLTIESDKKRITLGNLDYSKKGNE